MTNTAKEIIDIWQGEEDYIPLAQERERKRKKNCIAIEQFCRKPHISFAFFREDFYTFVRSGEKLGQSQCTV